MFEFPADLPVLGRPALGLQYQDEGFAYGFLFDRFFRVAACRTARGFMLPGCRLEKGEEPEPAIARAFLQEMGWVVEPEPRMAVVARYVDPSGEAVPVRRLAAFSKVHLLHVDERLEEDNSSFAWLRVDEALKLLREPEQAWGLQQAVFELF